MALDSITSEADRLTVKVASEQLDQLKVLVASNHPYLRPHTAARAALSIGLQAISKNPELLPIAVEQLNHRDPNRP
jgi:hypothetical protein